MKPIKSMKYHFFKNLPPLHLLFTEEDNVIVVRCLDFSISSHGQTIPEAVESINSSLMEYVNHGLENKNVKDLFDPDLKEYWDLYMTLEIEEEKQKFKENLTEDAARILHEGLAYAWIKGVTQSYKNSISIKLDEPENKIITMNI